MGWDIFGRASIIDKTIVTSVAKGFKNVPMSMDGIVPCCSQILICSREISFFSSSLTANKCAEALSVLVVLALECNLTE